MLGMIGRSICLLGVRIKESTSDGLAAGLGWAIASDSWYEAVLVEKDSVQCIYA